MTRKIILGPIAALTLGAAAPALAEGSLNVLT